MRRPRDHRAMPGLLRAWSCALLVATSTGCSLVTLSIAKRGLDEPDDRPLCHAWVLAPVTDVVLAGYIVLLGAVVGAEGGGAPSAAMFAVGGVFAGSTGYGVSASKRCFDHGAPPPPHAPDLSVAAARAILDRESARLATCGPVDEPVRVALVVTPEGRVARMHVAAATPPAVARCVAAVVESIEFPPSSAGVTFAHRLRW